LYEEHGASKKLTLTHYEEMGGLPRVVQTVIDGILDDDPPTRRHERNCCVLRSSRGWPP
jgi:hypothetical protein